MFLLRQEHFGLFCIAIEHLQIKTLAEQLLPVIEFLKMNVKKNRQTAVWKFFKKEETETCLFSHIW